VGRLQTCAIEGNDCLDGLTQAHLVAEVGSLPRSEKIYTLLLKGEQVSVITLQIEV
jgi:hypothetical protein